jgi:hypothetical protein
MDGDHPMDKKEKRLFRSSELVAKYYKYVGILPQGKDDKPNIKYETKDFTQNSKGNSLQLLNKASMGDEQIIMFNEKELQNKFKQV